VGIGSVTTQPVSSSGAAAADAPPPADAARPVSPAPILSQCPHAPVG